MQDFFTSTAKLPGLNTAALGKTQLRGIQKKADCILAALARDGGMTVPVVPISIPSAPLYSTKQVPGPGPVFLPVCDPPQYKQ